MKMFLVKTTGCGEIYATGRTTSEAIKAVEDRLSSHTPLFGDFDKRIASIELMGEYKAEDETPIVDRPKAKLAGEKAN